jgi:anthranilate phosphoribosyltransferase
MRHAGPTRRELGVATMFNFLGPLANPGRIRRQVVGVSDPAMAPKMLGVLASRGVDRAMVVFGHDGLDELTTTTTSTMLVLRDGAVTEVTVDPVALGLAPATLDQLRGGSAGDNAAFLRAVLDGRSGPHRDVVLLNAAAGCVVAGLADDLPSGLDVAAKAVDSGAAAGALEALVRLSNEPVG